MREIQAGDWVIWTDKEFMVEWRGKRLQVASVNEDGSGKLLSFYRPEWAKARWRQDHSWYSHRVRRDECYEVEQLLKEYGV